MGRIITIPLPKDLPENWNENQYVSPGGIEVGLTEQHGYNYLMKQVNNAQRAIEQLDANASSSLASSVTYYVETTGSDDIGDGSSSKPFASVQKAIDSIPHNLNGKAATIYLGSGTFAPFTLSYRHSGQVIIRKNPTLADYDLPIITGSCTVLLCTCRVMFNGIRINASDSLGVMKVQAASEVCFTYCAFDGINKASDGIRILSGDVNCGIAYCVFNNCANCVSTNHDSGLGGFCSVSIYSSTGADNTCGCYNNFAVVGFYGTTAATLGCDTLFRTTLTSGPSYVNGQLYTGVAPAELVE